MPENKGVYHVIIATDYGGVDCIVSDENEIKELISRFSGSWSSFVVTKEKRV